MPNQFQSMTVNEPKRLVPTPARFAIAIGAGVIACVVAGWRIYLAGPGVVTGDFSTFWAGARALLDGQSPYAVINPGPNTSFRSGFLYPLPAALILSPFALMPVEVAMVVFSGVSVAVLAFAFMQDGYWRLPLLLSLPVYWSTVSGQWAPLVTAAALLPPLGCLAIAKPTLGLSSFAYRPTRVFGLSAALVTLISLIVLPTWPREWLVEIAQRETAYYAAPIALPGGFLLLLSVLRWRRPEARLLVVMSCAPQTLLFYDQLPLSLVASSFRGAVVMAVVSWTAPFGAMAILGQTAAPLKILLQTTAPVILVLYYFPVLLVVLRRPNLGRVSPGVEKFAARLPRWLRGSAT